MMEPVPCPPAPLPLGPDEVHVWMTEEPEQVEDPRLLGAYLELLSSGERARHDRFRFEQHRRQYLVSHALLRLTLSRYAPVAPAAWEFVTVAQGRPEVRNAAHARLRFNLSHTEGMAVVAVGLDADLGVDVEAVTRAGDMMGVAERVFSVAELAALRALPSSFQQERFLTLWTLKEAYAKARGEGLALP
ncbi:MAG: 4'-phosphopantetheinyl transferase superfamily protein, partial [Myxococcaceae bacterium]|nr:4'-phosphopantetheinyl transferase superfamily protein [Myxococcaceae bacterium]